METIFLIMHTLFATGGDQSIFQKYGALADQNRSDVQALKLVIVLEVHTISTHMRGCSTIRNYMIGIKYIGGLSCRIHVDFNIMTTISSNTNTFTNGTISGYTI